MDWLTTKEASNLSGYNPEHIRRLVRKGKIKAELKGAMFWIDRASFLAYVKDAEKAKKKDKRHGPKLRKLDKRGIIKQ